MICHNPEQAERDAAVRAQLVARVAAAIADSDARPAAARAELVGKLRTQRGLGRFLRTTAGGQLRVDRAAVAREARLDGKFLLRTSDPTLSAEDVALGYKQLLQVERGWRDLKTTLELRPVYHRKEDRIRAHVLLCWLALLLIRVAETATQDTWRNLRHELQRMHVGTFRGPAGTVWQRTETTPPPARHLPGPGRGRTRPVPPPPASGPSPQRLTPPAVPLPPRDTFDFQLRNPGDRMPRVMARSTALRLCACCGRELPAGGRIDRRYCNAACAQKRWRIDNPERSDWSYRKARRAELAVAAKAAANGHGPLSRDDAIAYAREVAAADRWVSGAELDELRAQLAALTAELESARAASTVDPQRVAALERQVAELTAAQAVAFPTFGASLAAIGAGALPGRPIGPSTATPTQSGPTATATARSRRHPSPLAKMAAGLGGWPATTSGGG